MQTGALHGESPVTCGPVIHGVIMAIEREGLHRVDEVHTLIGAGSVSRGNGGGLDVANLFKPALARGELQCIGATTLGELAILRVRPLTKCTTFVPLGVKAAAVAPLADKPTQASVKAQQAWQLRTPAASNSCASDMHRFACSLTSCAAQASSASMWSATQPLSVAFSRCTCTSRRRSMR